jgi:hypothetical protein
MARMKMSAPTMQTGRRLMMPGPATRMPKLAAARRKPEMRVVPPTL